MICGVRQGSGNLFWKKQIVSIGLVLGFAGHKVSVTTICCGYRPGKAAMEGEPTA